MSKISNVHELPKWWRDVWDEVTEHVGALESVIDGMEYNVTEGQWITSINSFINEIECLMAIRKELGFNPSAPVTSQKVALVEAD